MIQWQKSMRQNAIVFPFVLFTVVFCCPQLLQKLPVFDAAAAACPRSVGIRLSAVAAEVSAVLRSTAACPDGLVSVLYRLLLEQRIVFLRRHVLEHGRRIHAAGLLGKSHADKTVHRPGLIGWRHFPWQIACASARRPAATR